MRYIGYIKERCENCLTFRGFTFVAYIRTRLYYTRVTPLSCPFQDFQNGNVCLRFRYADDAHIERRRATFNSIINYRPTFTVRASTRARINSQFPERIRAKSIHWRASRPGVYEMHFKRSRARFMVPHSNLLPALSPVHHRFPRRI